MSQVLADFRTKYPEYDQYDDEMVITGLVGKYNHENNTSVSFDDFSKEIGWARPPVESYPNVPDESQIGLMPRIGVSTTPLETTAGEAQEGLEGLSIKKLPEEKSMLDLVSEKVANWGAGAIERAGDIGGALMETVETVGRDIPAGGFVWEDGDVIPSYLSPEEFSKRDAPSIMKRGAKVLKDIDLGYQEKTGWKDVKEGFSKGGAFSASAYANVIDYGLEQGIKSIPDMVAAVYALPVYIFTRSGEIGEQRAINKGKEKADIMDVLEAAPVATASALLERIGAKGMTSRAKEELGKEMFKAGIKEASKRVSKQGLKSLSKESATEAFQEGVIEYTGERFGTKAAMDFDEALDRAQAAAVAGGVMGAATRTTTASMNEIKFSPERKIGKAFLKEVEGVELPSAEQAAIQALSPKKAQIKLKESPKPEILDIREGKPDAKPTLVRPEPLTDPDMGLLADFDEFMARKTEKEPDAKPVIADIPEKDIPEIEKPEVEQPPAEKPTDSVDLEHEGIKVAIPQIDQETVDQYNRATHLGKGRDLNQEHADTAKSIIEELRGQKHVLDTPEQKSKAQSLINDHMKLEADYNRWNSNQAAKNPSWKITGRSGRDMSKGAAKLDKSNRESFDKVKDLERSRSEIKKTLYEMRPQETKDTQAKNKEFKSIISRVVELSSLIKEGKPELFKATKQAYAKNLRISVEKGLEIDREGTIDLLKTLNKKLESQGGVVKAVGPRSKLGKLAFELLREDVKALDAKTTEDSGMKYPIADPPEYGDSDYKVRGGKIIQSDSDTFLKLSKPLTMDEETRENIDILKDHIKSGKEIDPPTLYVKDGKIVDHDGRHRAIAAKELGIKDLPVLVIDTESKPVTKTDFIGQQGESASVGDKPFKDWFKGSKVVDKQGKPLKVYHGTQATFTEFDKSKIGSAQKVDEIGFFFTTDKWEAEGFAHGFDPQPGDKKGKVMEAHLSIKNPLTIGVISEKIGKAPESGELGAMFYEANRRSIAKILKDSNYDGVIIDNAFIPFEPAQIRVIDEGIIPVDEKAVPKIGKETVVITPRSKDKHKVRYKVIESGDKKLVASNHIDGRVNKDYPTLDVKGALQMRDRSGIQSQAQVAQMSNNIDPMLLTDSKIASDGSPIVGSDYSQTDGHIVESGNGRIMALRTAYKIGKADHYKKHLVDEAASFGIDPGVIESMESPILVRERVDSLTDTEKAKFTKDANKPSVSQMTAIEQAVEDANSLNGLTSLKESKSGRITHKNNPDFIKEFFSTVMGNDPRETGKLLNKDGQLNDEGERRITNAVFVSVYGAKSDIMNKLIMRDSDQTKKITAGMLKAVPTMSRFKKVMTDNDRKDMDISNDFIDALTIHEELRKEGITLETKLNAIEIDTGHENRLEDENVVEVLKAIQELGTGKHGSAGKISSFLTRYVRRAENVIRDENPDIMSFESFTGEKIEKTEKITIIRDVKESILEKKHEVQFYREDSKIAPKRKRGQRVYEAPGSNYLGLHRSTGIPERVESVEVDGVKVRIPDKPQRIEPIKHMFIQIVGRRLYEGKIKKKAEGFFVPTTGEIRTKKKNDVEVLAHEMAHYLDHSSDKGIPNFKELYQDNRYSDEVKALSYTDATKDLQMKEGFAEFMRLWLTNSNQVELRAPRFYHAFQRKLKTDKKLYRKMKNLQFMAHRYYFQGPDKLGQSKLGKDISFRQWFDNWKYRRDSRVRAESIDMFHAARKIEQELTGKVGTVHESAWKQFRISEGGSEGVADYIMNYGTVNFDEKGDLKKTGDGLHDIFQPLKTIEKKPEHAGDRKVDLLMRYFAGSRATELYQQGRENLMAPETMKVWVKLGDTYPIFKEIHTNYQKFNGRMLDMMQESGLVTKETRSVVEKMNQNYVPFHRVREGLKEGGRAAGGIIKLEGGMANVKDILSNIQDSVVANTKAALQNRAKQRLFKYIAESPDGALFASNIAPDSRPVKVHQEEMLKKINDIFDDFEMEVNEIDISDPDFLTFWQHGIKPKLKESGNIVDTVMIDGKPKYYEVQDPLLQDMLLAMNPESYSSFMNVMFGIKNFFTRSITLGIEFTGANLVRDTTGAAFLSKENFIPFLDSFKGMYSFLAKDEHYQNFMKSGGGYSSRLEGQTKEGKARRRVKLDEFGVMSIPERILSTIDHMASAFEYGTRIGEFRIAKKGNKTDMDAGFQSREISTDFSARGGNHFLAGYIRTVPFLNAMIQSQDRIFREAVVRKKYDGNPTRLAMKSFIGVTIPTLLLYLLNKDDEDYKNIPEYERRTNWHIKTDSGYVKIPRPYDVGFTFGTLPELFFKYVEDDKGKDFANGLIWTLGQMYGINGTPAAMTGWWDVVRNEKWTGAPVVPSSLKDVEASERYTSNTAETFIRLGEVTGLSPVKAEHVFKAYTGYLGGYLLWATEKMLWDEKNFGPMPESKTSDNVFLRRFLSPKVRHSTASMEKFFELKEESDKVLSTFKKKMDIRRLLRGKKPPMKFKSDPLWGLTGKEKEVLFALNKSMNKIVSLVYGKQGLKTAELAIKYNKNLSGQEKREKIETIWEQRNKIFSQFYNSVDKSLTRAKKQLKEKN